MEVVENWTASSGGGGGGGGGGAYHLHEIPGNSSWKIKWYASFHLVYF